MKKVSILILLFVIHANAIAPVFLAGSAIAAAFTTPTATMLTLGTVGVGAAIITQQQNTSLKLQLEKQLPTQAETENALTDQNGKLNQLFQAVQILFKNKIQCISPVNEDKHTHARACGSTPQECCKKYMDKFKDQTAHEKGAYKIFKDGHYGKLKCCLEFDHTHKGFEIFDRNGNHKGERSCLDMQDDPCSFTDNGSSHYKPNSVTHKPRTPACGK